MYGDSVGTYLLPVVEKTPVSEEAEALAGKRLTAQTG